MQSRIHVNSHLVLFPWTYYNRLLHKLFDRSNNLENFHSLNNYLEKFPILRCLLFEYSKNPPSHLVDPHLRYYVYQVQLAGNDDRDEVASFGRVRSQENSGLY
jgi:hypothetical protein